MRTNYWKLICALALSQSAGLVGTIFTRPAIPTWYADLLKPAFNPPSWVFGPVWTVLFFLMGLSLYIVWEKGVERPGVKRAMGVFALQLALNVGWSAVFFGMKNPGLALIEICILWLSIAWTIYEFRKISRTASALLIPYLLWVTFATFLNLYIWILN